MPKLPRYGWFHRCEDCGQATSRVTVVKHRRKTRKVSVCASCRTSFVFLLLEEFNYVIIDRENVSEQFILVS